MECAVARDCGVNLLLTLAPLMARLAALEPRPGKNRGGDHGVAALNPRDVAQVVLSVRVAPEAGGAWYRGR